MRVFHTLDAGPIPAQRFNAALAQLVEYRSYGLIALAQMVEHRPFMGSASLDGRAGQQADSRGFNPRMRYPTGLSEWLRRQA